MINYLIKSLEIGISGFGGLAILGYIKSEFVEDKKLINKEEFFTGLSVAQFVPGTTAGNLMAYIGYKIGKSRLMFVMMVGFLFPAILSMFLLSAFYVRFGSLDLIEDIFKGLNIIVVILLLKTIEKIIVPLLKNKRNILLMLISFGLKIVFNLNVLLICLVISILELIISKEEVEFKIKQKENKFKLSSYFPSGIFLIIVISSFLLKEKNKFIELFFVMTKIGFFSFGGGIAALSIIKETVVENLNWITKEEFGSGYALAQMTPGPILNISVFVGYKLYGILGGIVASLGIFLPGIFIMELFSMWSDKILSNKYFKKILNGILLAFNGIIIYITLDLFNIFILKIENIEAINYLLMVKNLMFFLSFLFIYFKFKINVLKFILLGVIVSYFYYHKFDIMRII